MWIITRITTLLTIVCASINFGYTQVNNSCGLEMFQCRNGECIAGTLLCDGKADCKDQSDETECTTLEILCPDYAFRCKYGACVNRDTVCNGVKDCIDNSDETLPQCMTGINNQTKLAQCQTNEFKCENGECIRTIYVCDGTSQCTDSSDEVFARCGSLFCPPTAFRCTYGACINGDKLCNGIIDCVDKSDEDSKLCSGITWPSFSPVTIPMTTSVQTSVSPVTSITPDIRFCKTPSQPLNGYWKLHQSQCQSDQDCDIPEGISQLQSGSHLVYSCNTGYKIRGSIDVICSLEGKWLNIPECTEIRCKVLNTASTEAKCTSHNGNWVSCDSPVLPGTTADLKCRNSYQRETLFSVQRDIVTCSTNGQWEPEPIQCIPDIRDLDILLVRKPTKMNFINFDRLWIHCKTAIQLLTEFTGIEIRFFVTLAYETSIFMIKVRAFVHHLLLAFLFQAFANDQVSRKTVYMPI